MKKVILKKGKERPLQFHHPWVFSGAINRAEEITNGEIVEVFDSSNQFLGKGFYNSKSQITVRILEWDRDTEISEDWWRARIINAIKSREHIKNTDSIRLVYSEGDFIPGLIIDKYSEYLIVQILSLGIEMNKEMIIKIFVDLIHPKGVYERVDEKIKELEGLSGISQIAFGEIPEEIVINENGNKFSVNIKDGQKTGFYLDQRENREYVKRYSEGRKVLDCFSFTGGFSVYALKFGAESVSLVDSSEESLKIAMKNFELNGVSNKEIKTLHCDAFQELRKFRDRGEKFDMIILDPPKLAPSKYQKEKALRAYKDINILGMKLLNPGGILFTFSCSGAVTGDDLLRVLEYAAIDSGKTIQVIQKLSQSSDHPILISCPETEYLKGFVARVI
ncbi:MAG: class I SAM-dependent rRNA methyltransferase [bacterium]|nr:class I SAM-dependent rRNA methyltransferase [bacterium]